MYWLGYGLGWLIGWLGACGGGEKVRRLEAGKVFFKGCAPKGRVLPHTPTYLLGV